MFGDQTAVDQFIQHVSQISTESRTILSKVAIDEQQLFFVGLCFSDRVFEVSEIMSEWKVPYHYQRQPLYYPPFFVKAHVFQNLIFDPQQYEVIIKQKKQADIEYCEKYILGKAMPDLVLRIDDQQLGDSILAEIQSMSYKMEIKCVKSGQTFYISLQFHEHIDPDVFWYYYPQVIQRYVRKGKDFVQIPFVQEVTIFQQLLFDNQYMKEEFTAKKRITQDPYLYVVLRQPLDIWDIGQGLFFQYFLISLYQINKFVYAFSCKKPTDLKNLIITRFKDFVIDISVDFSCPRFIPRLLHKHLFKQQNISISDNIVIIDFEAYYHDQIDQFPSEFSAIRLFRHKPVSMLHCHIQLEDRVFDEKQLEKMSIVESQITGLSKGYPTLKIANFSKLEQLFNVFVFGSSQELISLLVPFGLQLQILCQYQQDSSTIITAKGPMLEMLIFKKYFQSAYVVQDFVDLLSQITGQSKSQISKKYFQHLHEDRQFEYCEAHQQLNKAGLHCSLDDVRFLVDVIVKIDKTEEQVDSSYIIRKHISKVGPNLCIVALQNVKQQMISVLQMLDDYLDQQFQIIYEDNLVILVGLHDPSFTNEVAQFFFESVRCEIFYQRLGFNHPEGCINQAFEDNIDDEHLDSSSDKDIEAKLF